MAESHDTRIRVLSIQASNMGHRSYAHEMRRYFSRSTVCELDNCWADESRELSTRALCWLIARRVPVKWVQDRNLDLHRSRCVLGIGYMGRRLLERKIARRRYAALHFHTQTLALLALSHVQRTPTVISGDMTAPQLAEQMGRNGWTIGPNVHLERRAFRAARHLVFWSEWAKRSAVRDHRIPAEKISVIPPAAPLDQFPPDRPALRRRPGRPRLLFIGEDFRRKGGSDLLEVFAARFSDQAELHLVSAAAPARQCPGVHVHTEVRAYSPKWIDLYSDADVFVLPTYREPFGLVFLEALAAGLPIVATGISAIPEMVDDGENGFLVAPGDREALAERLTRLLGSRELRLRMGAAGRRLAETRFDGNRLFGRLERVFAGVAKPSGVAPSYREAEVAP